jgi:hypothetical protein
MRKYLISQTLHISINIDSINFDAKRPISFVLEVSENEDFAQKLKEKEEQKTLYHTQDLQYITSSMRGKGLQVSYTTFLTTNSLFEI